MLNHDIDKKNTYAMNPWYKIHVEATNQILHLVRHLDAYNLIHNSDFVRVTITKC